VPLYGRGAGRIFNKFLRPIFSANRQRCISDLHAKFALRPHHVWSQIGCIPYISTVEVWYTSDLRPLRIGEEKIKKKDRNHGFKI